MDHALRSCGLLLALAAAASAAKPQVKISGGKLMGAYDQSSKIYAFKGIPYAAPPIGDLRWRPPQPVKPWDGVKEVTAFGARCMQGRVFDDMIFRDPGPSENCLTVNVWTSTVSSTAHLPVMFWIHGGGFAAGGSSEPRQDGENLAKRGVVVVSLNYRLNIFGFYTNPELSKESSQHASGNYGLLDMTAALQWVKQNIAAFGGDPTKVTIFGESAGSWAVSQLMASPLSKDLFARAIGESGAAFSATSLPVQTLAESEKANAEFSASISAPSLSALRAIPAGQLMHQALKPSLTRFSPVIDGYFLPQSVPDIFAAGKQAQTPLLAGWNHDEGGSAEQSNATVESLTAEAQKDFPGKSADFLKVYPAPNLEEAKQSAAAYRADEFIAFATWKWIEAQAASGAPVYRYLFTHKLPLPNDIKGAYHSEEIEFVFDNLANKDEQWGEADKELSNSMATYWTNFAKIGNPNGPGLPEWPQFKSRDGQIMILDAPPHAAPEEHRDRYEFLSSK